MGKARRFRRLQVAGYECIIKNAEWLESPSYRDLRPLARCLLEEFLIVYRPSLNGRLSLPTRKAARRLGIAENTVLNAFDDLVEHGFIELIKGHDWAAREAREWRLTFMLCNGREPTDDWRNWGKDQPVRRSPRSRKKSRSQNSRQTAAETEADRTQKLQQAPQLAVVQRSN